MKIKKAKSWLLKNKWNIAKAKNGLMNSAKTDQNILKKQKYCLKILKKK